jgi:hypothetical protein
MLLMKRLVFRGFFLRIFKTREESGFLENQPVEGTVNSMKTRVFWWIVVQEFHLWKKLWSESCLLTVTEQVASFMFFYTGRICCQAKVLGFLKLSIEILNSKNWWNAFLRICKFLEVKWRKTTGQTLTLESFSQLLGQTTLSHIFIKILIKENYQTPIPYHPPPPLTIESRLHLIHNIRLHIFHKRLHFFHFRLQIFIIKLLIFND